MIWPSADIMLEAAKHPLSSFPAVRDIRLLESALGSAQSLEAYATDDPFEIAAQLVFGIIRNHPLVDGNKRFAWISGCSFLELNDIPISSPTPYGDRVAAELLKKVASSEAGIKEIASFLAGLASAKLG